MDDDDDFGGFEAAESVQTEVEASPNPWLLYATTAQTAASRSTTASEGGSEVTQDSALISETEETDKLSSAASNSSLTEAGPESDVKVIPGDGHCDGVTDKDPPHRQTRADADSALQPESSHSSNQSTCGSGHRSSPHSDSTAAHCTNVLSTFDHQRVNDLQQEVETLRSDRDAVQRQLTEVTSHLSHQRELYTQCQERHQRELSELRQAGHDALAVMVEEYKEICRVSVLEEKERCLTLVTEVITDERQRLSDQLRLEQDKLQEELREERGRMEAEVRVERGRMEAEMREMMTRQDEQHRTRIEEVITEECDKSKACLQSALQEEEQRCRSVMEEAVKRERVASSQLISLHKEELSSVMADVKKETMKSCEEMISEERLKCQSSVKEAVREERMRGEEAGRRQLIEATSHIKTHIMEERKAGDIVRNRSLAAIDLFLEGARGQLSVLLQDGNQPD